MFCHIHTSKKNTIFFPHSQVYSLSYIFIKPILTFIPKVQNYSDIYSQFMPYKKA